MSQRLGVNYGYIQGYRNSTIFDGVSLDIAVSINPNTSIKNKVMMEKHLPTTKMYNSIQRMLNFCALLPYTLLSFCFIFVVSIQFGSAGRWILRLSKYFSWLYKDDSRHAQTWKINTLKCNIDVAHLPTFKHKRFGFMW